MLFQTLTCAQVFPEIGREAAEQERAAMAVLERVPGCVKYWSALHFSGEVFGACFLNSERDARSRNSSSRIRAISER